MRHDRIPGVALLAADRRGLIRYASPEAQELFQERAKVGFLLAPILEQIGIDASLLEGRAPATRLTDCGLPAPHLCNLVCDRQGSLDVWLLYLQRIPVSAATTIYRDVSELAAAAAHEIRNPLAAARGIIQLLQYEWQGPGVQDAELALRELDRVNELVTDLMALLHPMDNVRERLDLREAARDGAASFSALAASRDQHIEFELGEEELPIEVSARQLHQVLLNLLRNASEASAQGGVITLRACNLTAFQCLCVLDRGPGFLPAVADRLFVPFFTTKPAGTGLGLAICRRVVETHGGTISVFNRPGGGGGVAVHLPAAADA